MRLMLQVMALLPKRFLVCTEKWLRIGTLGHVSTYLRGLGETRLERLSTHFPNRGFVQRHKNAFSFQMGMGRRKETKLETPCRPGYQRLRKRGPDGFGYSQCSVQPPG